MTEPKLPCGCPAEMDSSRTRWLHNPGCPEAHGPNPPLAASVAPSGTSPHPEQKWSKIIVSASNEDGFVSYEETYEGPLDDTYRKMKTQQLRWEAEVALLSKKKAKARAKEERQ